MLRQEAFVHERPHNDRVDWYYKGGLIVGLIWAAARALGAYGEAARDLDINFLFGFLLTTGGWAAVFLVTDRVAKFLGWKRVPPEPDPVATVTTAGTDRAVPVAPSGSPATGARRSSRRQRR